MRSTRQWPSRKGPRAEPHRISALVPRHFLTVWGLVSWPSALLAVATTVLLLSGVPTPAAVPPQGQVEGEVIQVFSTMIVIKNDQGHATILQLTPRTQLGGQFKPGDKVVAYVTPYGVTSIQPKARTALIP